MPAILSSLQESFQWSQSWNNTHFLPHPLKRISLQNILRPSPNDSLFYEENYVYFRMINGEYL
jgi:hypothetical protein